MNPSIKLPECDELGRPKEKMPDCPKCGNDEFGMIAPGEAFCYSCGFKFIETDIFPKVGAKAIAVIGPDYAPVCKVEVEIVSKASLDSWVCQEPDGRLITVRTRKLSKA